MNTKRQRNKIFPIFACAGFAFLTMADALFAARCHTYSLTQRTSNPYMCVNVAARGSKDTACKFDSRALCVSACSKYNCFKDACLRNKACEWHPYSIDHSCQEKKEGWDPVLLTR